MALLLLGLMLTACAAIPQDLSGKVFTFPEETDTAHVILLPSRQEFKAVTVCFRSFTDLHREHSLFSLSTASSFNEFLVFKSLNEELNLHVKGNFKKFNVLDYKINMWHSICSTWNSTSGIGQLWLNGNPSNRKFISSGVDINGPVKIVLGQDQDAFGGGFDSEQSLVGMLTDVHMWDHVLSPCAIHRYTDELNYTPGNVLSWSALDFEIKGRVLIEERQRICYN
ncbi:mucosal pentraxin-like [Echeneis naucrates]|uniref:Pentraxin family member n=1 Tax=Echeneis naucrates TaxID=173247 RepID=A0A665TCQ3_ECHNA|nr:mucosal pentraxin-like [Echeneis naucrates]